MKLLSEYIIQLWKSNKVIKNSPINSLVITEMQKAFQIFHFDFGGLQKPEYYIYWVIFVNIILPTLHIVNKVLFHYEGHNSSRG